MLTLKRGDTLDLTGQIKTDHNDGLGLLVRDMTGWTVMSQLRVSNATFSLVGEITCVWIDPVNAVLNLHAAAISTAAYPIGNLLIDIKFTDPTGFIVSTQTETIVIVESITHG